MLPKNFSPRKTRFSSKLLQQTVPPNVSDGRFDTRKAYATVGANRRRSTGRSFFFGFLYLTLRKTQ